MEMLQCGDWTDEELLEDHFDMLTQRFEARVDGKVNQDFHRRLDEGWNHSESRFCHSCNRFVCTTEQYWKKKKRYWVYLDTGKIGTNFRSVADCEEHEGEENRVIEQWIKHGKGEIELKGGGTRVEARYASFLYLKCPMCTFANNAADLSACFYRYDDFDGCGCPLMQCRCC